MTTVVHHSPTHAGPALRARHNETTRDRAVRIVVGLTAVIVGAVLLTTPGAVLAYRLESLLVLVGLVLAVTGVTGYSPLYALCGHVPESLRAEDGPRP